MRLLVFLDSVDDSSGVTVAAEISCDFVDLFGVFFFFFSFLVSFCLCFFDLLDKEWVSGVAYYFCLVFFASHSVSFMISLSSCLEVRCCGWRLLACLRLHPSAWSALIFRRFFFPRPLCRARCGFPIGLSNIRRLVLYDMARLSLNAYTCSFGQTRVCVLLL